LRAGRVPQLRERAGTLILITSAGRRRRQPLHTRVRCGEGRATRPGEEPGP
jgi:hypothetical protein